MTGTVLDLTTQRVLFRRWTSETTPAQERVAGLLALLHAATNADIRSLTFADIDLARQTVSMGGRPSPTPMDPLDLGGNPRIPPRARENRDLESSPHLESGHPNQRYPRSSKLSHSVAGVSRHEPADYRPTRVSQLVTDLGPKLAATVLGVHDTGLVRYLADNVDRDRLSALSVNIR